MFLEITLRLNSLGTFFRLWSKDNLLAASLIPWSNVSWELKYWIRYRNRINGPIYWVYENLLVIMSFERCSLFVASMKLFFLWLFKVFWSNFCNFNHKLLHLCLFLLGLTANRQSIIFMFLVCKMTPATMSHVLAHRCLTTKKTIRQKNRENVFVFWSGFFLDFIDRKNLVIVECRYFEWIQNNSFCSRATFWVLTNGYVFVYYLSKVLM